MTKAEFLEMMEQKLTGELDENTVAKTLRYYSEYIDSETRKGRSEEEVLDELGSPLLIARTILDTHVSGATDFSKKRTEQEPKEEEKGDKSPSVEQMAVSSDPCGDSVFAVHNSESAAPGIAAGAPGTFCAQPF